MQRNIRTITREKEAKVTLEPSAPTLPQTLERVKDLVLSIEKELETISQP